MTFLQKLAGAVDKNNSLVCVGLDSDKHKLPEAVRGSQLTFNQAIVDATADLVCAYKLNSAFYEGAGPVGIEQLKQSVDYIHQRYPEIPVILDAKRADIGNTNDGYIDYIFNYLEVDAVTLHPYLGYEALEPFFQLKDKGLIILCRTSNPGVAEIQDVLVDGKPFYQYLAERIATHWNTNQNCLLVVGATYPTEMRVIRQTVGDEIVFLVPGVGAQGGDIEQTVKAGKTSRGDGLIIHSARSIIFASSGDDYADAARKESESLKNEINKYRK